MCQTRLLAAVFALRFLASVVAFWLLAALAAIVAAVVALWLLTAAVVLWLSAAIVTLWLLTAVVTLWVVTPAEAALGTGRQSGVAVASVACMEMQCKTSATVRDPRKTCLRVPSPIGPNASISAHLDPTINPTIGLDARPDQSTLRSHPAHRVGGPIANSQQRSGLAS